MLHVCGTCLDGGRAQKSRPVAEAPATLVETSHAKLAGDRSTRQLADAECMRSSTHFLAYGKARWTEAYMFCCWPAFRSPRWASIAHSTAPRRRGIAAHQPPSAIHHGCSSPLPARRCQMHRRPLRSTCPRILEGSVRWSRHRGPNRSARRGALGWLAAPCCRPRILQITHTLSLSLCTFHGHRDRG